MELLALDLEGAGVHASVPAASLPDDARVLEDRNVEVHRRFGRVVEHQEGNDFLHWVPLGIGSSPG